MANEVAFAYSGAWSSWEIIQNNGRWDLIQTSVRIWEIKFWWGRVNRGDLCVPFR